MHLVTPSDQKHLDYLEFHAPNKSLMETGHFSRLPHPLGTLAAQICNGTFFNSFKSIAYRMVATRWTLSGEWMFDTSLGTIVIHLNETVEGNICLISKTSLI